MKKMEQTQDVQINAIYATKDYSKFSTVEGNRDLKTKSSRYKKLYTSILEKGQITPAQVTEDGRIIDGQHRLYICKDLNVEFKYYLSAESGDDDVITMNSNRQDWSLDNYVLFYATRNVVSYKQLLEVQKKYDDFKLPTIAELCSTSASSVRKFIEDGSYKFSDKYIQILDFCRELNEEDLLTEEGGKYTSPHLVRALKRLSVDENSKFSLERLKSQLQKWGPLNVFASEKDIKKVIERKMKKR